MPVEIAVAPASAGPFCAYCRKTFSSPRRCRQHTSQVHLAGSGKAALLAPPPTAQAKVRVGGVTRGPRPSTTRFRPRSARALRSTARPQLVQTLAALRTKKKLSGFTAKKLQQKRARGPRQALRRLQIMRTAIGVQRPPWISRIAEPARQKERKRKVALNRRNMAEWSRGRVKFDRLALDFGAPGTINGTTQTLNIENIGKQTVYFSPWVRGKFFKVKGGFEKRALEPSDTAAIEVKLVGVSRALRGRLESRLDITFQLPGRSGVATVTRPISA